MPNHRFCSANGNSCVAGRTTQDSIQGEECWLTCSEQQSNVHISVLHASMQYSRYTVTNGVSRGVLHVALLRCVIARLPGNTDTDMSVSVYSVTVVMWMSCRYEHTVITILM